MKTPEKIDDQIIPFSNIRQGKIYYETDETKKTINNIIDYIKELEKKIEQLQDESKYHDERIFELETKL